MTKLGALCAAVDAKERETVAALYKQMTDTTTEISEALISVVTKEKLRSELKDMRKGEYWWFMTCIL